MRSSTAVVVSSAGETTKSMPCNQQSRKQSMSTLSALLAKLRDLAAEVRHMIMLVEQQGANVPELLAAKLARLHDSMKSATNKTT